MIIANLFCGTQDPEVAQAFQDISSNPANIAKYQNNPKVQALITKLSSKFGADGAPEDAGSSAGGPPPTGGAGTGSGESPFSSKVPEQPDID